MIAGHLLGSNELKARFHPEERVKVRLDIDTDLPPLFEVTTEQLEWPVVFSIRTFAMSDLFACKLHALLCRAWKRRIKGRDWFDFAWFVGRKVPCHLAHLEARLRQSGHYTSDRALTKQTLYKLLEESIERLNMEVARQDVTPFLKAPSVVDSWSKEFFRGVAERVQVI